MENNYCIVITTAGNEQNAKEITKELLEKRLVACVQESKRFSSYWWNNKIEENEEFILAMKCKKSLYKEIESEILKIHEYEVPEIVMIDILEGYNKYLDWIDGETK